MVNERELWMENIKMNNPLSFKNFLKTDVLVKTIKDNPEYGDLPDVLDKVMMKMAALPDVSKCEFTGSMARMALGYGDMERYYQGQEGADNLLKHFSDNLADPEVQFIRDNVSSLASSELDMDFCFTMNGGKNLFDLYDSFLKKNNLLSGFTSKESSVNIKTKDGLVKDYPVKSFSVSLNGKYKMETILEPIQTNPSFMKITLHFFAGQNEIIHEDVSLYPKDGIQARDNKRHGGRSLRSQDYGRIPLTVNTNGILMHISEESKIGLIGYDSIGIEGKSLVDIAELSMRSLRITEIARPKVLESDLSKISPLFDPKSIFKIRKKIEEFTINDNIRILPEDMKLTIRDLILSFNFDPYATLHLLQDTGLYKLFPGLSNLSGDKWRKLFLNENLNLVPGPNNKFSKPEERSLASVISDQIEYRDRNLVDGFVRVLEALHELESPESFDFDTATKNFFYNSKNESQTFLSNNIVSILRNFGGGLTEKEIQNLYELVLGHKLVNEKFREKLLEHKLNGEIDKQIRKIGYNKKVVLYTLRNSSHKTAFEKLDKLIRTYLVNGSEHGALNRVRKYVNENNIDSKNLIAEVYNALRTEGITSIEGFRSLSFKDFEILNKDLGFDIKQFTTACRAIQIICEDALRYSKFLK